ncbi:MAG: hypothetical protein PHC88_09805 [Terrimicrobiaceae bacterium]|nr:hypothetical protein [Terrimicrobiaceae bacterium]
MDRSPLFRVSSYSISTARITIHKNEAATLFKFLNEEGIGLEPMVEAAGTVLLAFVDETGRRYLEPETDIITFVADATPSILQPVLQRWLEGGSSAAPQKEEDAENGHRNSQEPEGGPTPGA